MRTEPLIVHGNRLPEQAPGVPAPAYIKELQSHLTEATEALCQVQDLADDGKHEAAAALFHQVSKALPKLGAEIVAVRFECCGRLLDFTPDRTIRMAEPGQSVEDHELPIGGLG